jgi:hypothetical protein
MINQSHDITEAKILELSSMIREFKEKFNNGTDDPDNFMTLNDMERLWSELRNESDKIYSDMFSEFLSNIDEEELIHKKKLNTKTKESN